MSWKKAYLETRILSASPLELVTIAYEHTIIEVRNAADYLAQGDVVGRSRSIAKAIAILGELDGSLDHNAGGEIAGNLARLYQYMRERLTVANLEQIPAPLFEVAQLLETLADAWGQIHGPAEPNAVPSAWNASSALQNTAEPSLAGWSA